DFEAVFEAAESGRADRALIPIENTLHGSVHENYDLLREHDLEIVAESHLRIRHRLLSVGGASLASIRTVTSHPQALGQCRAFLRTRLPDATIVPSYDTAGAARGVARSGDPSMAAIAGRRAADEYGLITLAEDIESNHNNFTRFLTLARPGTAAPPRDETPTGGERPFKTSIVYAQRDNVPGSLFKSLAVFALRDIDLYKIESRPLVGSPGQYIFYLDLQGSRDDEPVRRALAHLDEVAASVKVLGTYVAAPVEWAGDGAGNG
ncbi:MAG: prephenate dehydratase, partial [Rhodothermales bacterium]|nr:prephenate dehydratase [Rhodothermales bacterium]